MNKKALAKIPVPEADEGMIAQANLIADTENKFFIKSRKIRTDDNKYVLWIAIYRVQEILDNCLKPLYLVFQTKSDYITRNCQSDKLKWLTACILNLDLGCFYRSNFILADEETKNAISSYLPKNYSKNDTADIINGLFELQQEIMAKRLKKRHMTEIERIDAKMSTVPNLPKDFKKWVFDTGMKESRYIFYHYTNNKKPKNGYCSYCHSNVEVENSKHNGKGICPHCHKGITFKALGKVSYICDKSGAYLFQKSTDGKGVWLRYFVVLRNYYKSERKIKENYQELARWFMDGKQDIYYEYTDYKNTGETRWCEETSKFSLRYGALYSKNLKSELKDTAFKYSGIYEHAVYEEGHKFLPFRYIRKYLKHPVIEYFSKIGLHAVIDEISEWSYTKDYIDIDGNSFKEILKFDKRLIPLIKECQLNTEEITCAEDIRRVSGKILTAEQIEEMRTKYGFCFNDWTVAIGYSSIQKVMNYLGKQKIPRSGCSNNYYYHQHPYANILSDYSDYIGWCADLKYDMKNDFVLFPKNFYKTHDITAETYRQEQDRIKKLKLEVKEKEYRKRMAAEKDRYLYEFGGLKVVIPMSKKDLTNEGQALHHCVGTYAERVLTGETVILFIRRKEEPDKSYYTLEVKKGRFMQCRGSRNCGMTKEVEDFVNRLMERIKWYDADNICAQKQLANEQDRLNMATLLIKSRIHR